MQSLYVKSWYTIENELEKASEDFGEDRQADERYVENYENLLYCIVSY